MNKSYIPGRPDFTAAHYNAFLAAPLSSLTPAELQKLLPAALPSAKELEDALYAYKWMMMGDTSTTLSVTNASPAAAQVLKNSASDAHAAKVDAAAAAADIPAALRALLASQVRISGAASVLTAAVKDAYANPSAVTAAAWDLADAGGVVPEMQARLSKGAAGVAAAAQDSAAAPADGCEAAADALEREKDVQDFELFYINPEELVA